MSKQIRKWRKIADSSIRHRWDRACDCKLTERSVYVDPAFYENSGIPVCEQCGQDRIYVRTEVLR